MYYHGLKFHALAFRRINKLPFPEQLLVTSASVNDLYVWSSIPNRCFWGDKIYCNKDFFADLEKSKDSVMLTPVKSIKGQTEQDKQRDRAFNDLYSKAVLKVRQPIEGFFNWLI